MEMQASATRAAELMKALSSENRLMILCQLAEAEKTVGHLSEELGLRQAAVSQQLALLRKDGLVAARRDGRSIHYRLIGREAQAVIALLYELFCAPAKAAPKTQPGGM
ncbi:ArsR/SmtB family transcription factor [Pelagibius sp.]